MHTVKSFGQKAAAALLVAVASTSQADVTLYQHCNYQGDSITLSNGSYGLVDLINRGILNDEVSSIKVSGNSQVTLFQDDEFKGRTFTLSSDNACLSTNNFNDILSSVKVSNRESTVAANRAASPIDCGHVDNIIWEGANDLIGAVPGISEFGKFMIALSKIGNNITCNSNNDSLHERIQKIARKEVRIALSAQLKEDLRSLDSSIKGWGTNLPNNDTLNNWFELAQVFEGHAKALGFGALDYQLGVTSIKTSALLGLAARANTSQERNVILDRLKEAAKLSLKRLASQEGDLESYLASVETNFQYFSDDDGGPREYAVRGWIRYPNGNRFNTQWFECSPSVGNNCKSAMDRKAENAVRSLKSSKNQEIRSRVLSNEYNAVKNKLKGHVPSNQQPNVHCGARTWRTQSDKTWAEFRMPSVKIGTKLKIKGGSRARYVFPKCHRAWWDNLTFTCQENNQWKLDGKMGANALCHSANQDQDYLRTGNR